MPVLDSIPTDIVLIIIQHLDYPSILSLECTCRYLRTIVQTHGWNLFLRQTDFYYPSLTVSVHTKCWSQRDLVRHLILAQRAWTSRKFVTRPLGPDWNKNLHPVLALHDHRLIVGAGNSLTTYKFKPPLSRWETTHVSFERIIAFPKDARKDITGIGFHNDGNDIIVSFVHGGVGRINSSSILNVSSPKRTSMEIPNLALVKNFASPRIRSLSISGDSALIVDSSGGLTLFSLKHFRPEIVSTTNPFGERKPIAWSGYLSFNSSSGYAAVGISSSVTPLSIYNFSESAIASQASAHLSPVTTERSMVGSTAVYALAGNSTSMNNTHNQFHFSDQVIVSGWYHGRISVHDLRCPTRTISGQNKMLLPTLSLRDPLSVAPIYSLSVSDHRIAAGSAQYSLLQLYDVRVPHSGFSIFLPQTRASSPVYSTVMESTRIWAGTESHALVVDFGKTSNSTFPTILKHHRGVGQNRVKAPTYEHTEHHLHRV